MPSHCVCSKVSGSFTLDYFLGSCSNHVLMSGEKASFYTLGVTLLFAFTLCYDYEDEDVAYTGEWKEEKKKLIRENG